MSEGRETETDGRDGARGADGRDTLWRTLDDELDTDLGALDTDRGALLEEPDDLERNDDDGLELGRLELLLRLLDPLLELPTLRDTPLLRLPRI
jgi:hypothetical protein